MNKNYQAYLIDQATRAGSKWARKPLHEEIFIKNLQKSINRIKDFISEPTDICCMGIRSGTEVFLFKDNFKYSRVVGVDISEDIKTIRKADYNVEILLQDFNHLPEEWGNTFDLIFSNSIDHAFSIKETLNEWYRILKDKGYLFLEFSTTPKNLIEHSFNKRNIGQFMKKFKKLDMWESKERNMICGLYQK